MEAVQVAVEARLLLLSWLGMLGVLKYREKSPGGAGLHLL